MFLWLGHILYRSVFHQSHYNPVMRGIIGNLALTFATLTWAGNFAVARLINDDIQPATLAELRWSIACLLLLPFVLADFTRLKAVFEEHWKWLTLMGLTGISGFHFLAYLALEFTSATNMSMIMGATPATVLLISSIKHGEKHPPSRIAGVTVCFLGIVILVGGKLTVPNAGDVIGALAMPLWAYYVAALRDIPPGLSGTTLTALVTILGSLILAPFAAAEIAWFGWPVFNTRVILGVLYVGAVASGIAYLAWSFGVKKLGPSAAAPYMNLVSLFGVIIAVTILGERLTLTHAAAAILIISGLMLSGRRETPK